MPGGEIELSNAGHCPPIWLRDGSAVTLPPTSVPIGLFRAAPFPTTRVTLAAGDALVLYTDGITEATDADGCQYGVERLLRALEGRPNLAVPDLVSRSLSDLAHFRADTAGRDDVTLFVLRRRGDGTA